MAFKNFSIVFLIFSLVLSACSGELTTNDTDIGSSEISLTTGTSDQTNSNSNENSGVSISEVTVETATRPSSYKALSFSDYIFYDAEEAKFLIDWNFFPSTRYDSVAKTLTLPCEMEISRTTVDGLSFSENVPLTDLACQNELVLDLSDATFKAYGLVFNSENELSVLVDDFNIIVTLNGFETTEGDVIVLEAQEAGDLITVLSKI